MKHLKEFLNEVRLSDVRRPVSADAVPDAIYMRKIDKGFDYDGILDVINYIEANEKFKIEVSVYDADHNDKYCGYIEMSRKDNKLKYTARIDGKCIVSTGFMTIKPEMKQSIHLIYNIIEIVVNLYELAQ